MITLYTLPTCPICEIIKKKLQEKRISYIEEPFEKCQTFVNTERAPVMAIYNNSSLEDTSTLTNPYKILTSPKEMSEWINK